MAVDKGQDAGEFDLAAFLGAEESFATQRFSVYVPDRDRHGQEFGAQRRWVLEALRLLTAINGGATAMPAVEGGWVNDEGKTVWEHPVVVYSYIRPADFIANALKVREFLHRLARETDQGEIGVEFAGRFLRIRRFDAG